MNSGSDPTAPAAAPSAVVRSVVCTRCGCGCDDIDLTLTDGRVVEARNACDLGRPWFLTPLVESDPAATVEGRAVTVDEGAAAVADLLAGADRPLVWGLVHLACEAQRLAVQVAERVRGVIDPAAGPNHPAAVTAFAEWGEVAATLGEVASQRALVVLWFARPERTHPRLLERWRIERDGGERLVRFHHGAPAQDAWTIPPGRELEFLWILRELARARAARKEGSTQQAGTEEAGAENRRTSARAAGEDLRPLAVRLLERLSTARYAVLAFDAAAADPAQQHALRALAATLNAITRFRLFPLQGPGNRLGAEAVLSWQTGFPAAVDFGSGSPRANGGEFSAPRLLARGEVDAALVLCASPGDYDPGALRSLRRLAVAVLDSGPNPLAASARAVLRSAPYGLASGGTFFRSDGVALGLRPALSSRYPSEEEWLTRILAHLPARREPVRSEGSRASVRSEVS